MNTLLQLSMFMLMVPTAPTSVKVVGESTEVVPAKEEDPTEKQIEREYATPHPDPQFLPFQGQGDNSTTLKWSRKRIFSSIRRSMIAKVNLIISIGLISILGIYYGSVDRNVSDGTVSEHISWIENHITSEVLRDGWKLKSVTQSKEKQIDIEISITDPSFLRSIKSLPSIARGSLLKYACPAADSDIKVILKKGWHLWVVLKNSSQTLTGGTCHYPGARN
jgi:hypothetical protein